MAPRLTRQPPSCLAGSRARMSARRHLSHKCRILAMRATWPARPALTAVAVALALSSGVLVTPVGGQAPAAAEDSRGVPGEPREDVRPDFARMAREQAATDRAWQTASTGYMQIEKISYRSEAGDLDIPAFVFQPLRTAGAKAHPGL